jgi:D-lactate dehydrogenase
MRIAMFDTHRYDREAFEHARVGTPHELTYFEPRLTAATAALATGFPAVCAFVNDRLDGETLETLQRGGVRLVLLRSAGFNHVDLAAAARLGLAVARVPAYSPHAVAEHTFALLLALVRKLPRAHARVRDGNFSLDGLVGTDLFGKTIGVVGTGQIGAVTAGIARGFGCHVLAVDPAPDPALVAAGVRYVALDEMYAHSDVVTLHVPLGPTTRHLIDAAALGRMKRGVILINTSRGALIDTPALIDALKTGHIGGAALDVYEEEAGIFFADHSDLPLQDDVLARLLTFPNVLITSHQAFLTHEALGQIAATTLTSATRFERGEPLGAVACPT